MRRTASPHEPVRLTVLGEEEEERFRRPDGGGQVLERDFAAGELVHGQAEERGGAFRAEADSHDLGMAGGADLHGAGELAHQEGLRLFFPGSVLQGFERLAEVEDQLRVAIGDDALDGTGIRFEEPEAVDDLGGGRRGELAVNHLRK